MNNKILLYFLHEGNRPIDMLNLSYGGKDFVNLTSIPSITEQLSDCAIISTVRITLNFKA